MLENTNNTIRLSIYEFFIKYDIQRVVLAEMLGVARQRITNLQASSYNYMIEINFKEKKLRIIKPEVISVECNLTKSEIEKYFLY